MASRFSTLQVEEYISDVTFCRISAWQTFHLDTFLVPPHPVVEALPQDYFLVVTARHVVKIRRVAFIMYKKAIEKYLLFLAVMVQMHYLCKL